MICLQTGAFINDPFIKVSITCVLPSGSAVIRGPFPSSLQSLLQGESTCYEYQFLFILELELITIVKISHLDSL